MGKEGSQGLWRTPQKRQGGDMRNKGQVSEKRRAGYDEKMQEKKGQGEKWRKIV